MRRKIWYIISTFLALALLFFTFQNFTYKMAQKAPPPTDDFNALIEESQKSQKELARELQKAHPPSKVNAEGLVRKDQQMKRERLEGTEESVAAKSSDDFFKSQRPQLPEQTKDMERLSQEFKENQ